MKKFLYIAKIQSSSCAKLWVVADEAFDWEEPRLFSWDGRKWTLLNRYDPPTPDVLSLGQQGDLLVFCSYGVEKAGLDSVSLFRSLEISYTLFFRAAARLPDQKLVILGEGWTWEDPRLEHSELWLFDEESGLVQLACFAGIKDLNQIALAAHGVVFLGGRTNILKCHLENPLHPIDAPPQLLETGITGDMCWDSLAVSTDQHLYAGGVVGTIAQARALASGDYTFEFLSMGRDDCAIDQLIALPDNSILCVFAGRLYCIRGLTPEDITPPRVEHVTCVAAASDGLVVGTLEQGAWVGPPWRQLPPIEVPD